MKFIKLYKVVIYVTLFSSCTTPSVLTTKELYSGDLCNNKSDYNSAIIHYQNYLDNSKLLGKYRNLETEADVNRKIAHSYSTSGQYSKTIFYLNEARMLDSLDNNHVEFIEDLRLLGMANAYSNKYDEALSFLLKAINLTDGFGNSYKENKQQTLADIYFSLAKINTVLGNFILSNQYINKSLIIYEKINDSYGISQALLHIAWLQVEEGNFPEAESNLSKSIEITKKMRLFTFEQDNLMGNIFEKKGKYEEALRCQLQALAQADSSKISPQIIWSNLKVGDSYKSLGDNDKATRYYQNALNLNSKIIQSNLSPAIDYRVGNNIGAYKSFMQNGIKYGIGISGLKLGEMFKNEQPDSALFYYNQALSVFEILGTSESINLANLFICELYIKQGKNKEALKSLFPIYKSTTNDEISWQASSFIADAYENIGNDSLSIKYNKNAIEIIEKIRESITMEEFRDSYLSNKVSVYDKLIQLLQKQNNTKEAWYYVERARARSFLDMIEGQKIGKSQESDSTLIKKEQRLQSEISRLLKNQYEIISCDSTRSSSTPFLSKQLNDKENEYDDVVKQIKVFKSKYYQLISATTLNITQLQNKINKDQILVEYWCGKDNLQIYVITKDSLNVIKVSISDSDLKNKIELCRNEITNSEDQGKVYLKELYNILWSPIEKFISTDKKVCIIPHQYLHYLPFAALYKDKYLVEKYFISNSASASLFKDETPLKSEDSFLGIAKRISNVGDFTHLENTEQEIMLIQKYFPHSTIAINDHLNESYVKESIPKASIIHFATHGFYDEQYPLNSSLLLNSDSQNDGRFTAYEIYNSSIQAKLTTLSACQTSLGKMSKGDEIISLNRAFLYAGSSNVISTLWNISDKSTPKLLNDFYSFYKQGYSFTESLCYAQRKFINQTSSNPMLWSGFVLYK